jgi:hypothetical protein
LNLKKLLDHRRVATSLSELDLKKKISAGGDLPLEDALRAAPDLDP